MKEYKVTKCVLVRGLTSSARPFIVPEGAGSQHAGVMEEGCCVFALLSLQLGAGILGEGWAVCYLEVQSLGIFSSALPGDGDLYVPKARCLLQGPAKVGRLSLYALLFFLSGQLITHLGSDFPPGAGVLDVMYESPSTLLSCGYDTYVRYWDLRTSTR